MKNNIIGFIIAAILVILIFYGSGVMQPTTTYSDSAGLNNEESVGAHCLFTAHNEQDYLNFLNNFDETKYEMVSIDITNSNYNTYYHVTYKVLPEEITETE